MKTANESGISHGTSPRDVIRRRFRQLNRSMKDVRRGRCKRGELHQLRIDCRRTDALLRVLRGGIHGKARRWLRCKIRSIRRRSNPIRDDDVLRSWLVESGRTSKKAMRALVRDRRQRIPQVVGAVERLQRSERFRRSVRRLIGDVEELSRSSRIGAVFARGLFRELGRFVVSLPDRRLETERLHPMRVASKRLRYALEASTEIWPDLALTELIDMLKSTQTQLGSFHDATIRERRLGEFCVSRREPAERLADANTYTAQTDAFWNWWLGQPLERTLANATAEIVSLLRRDQTD